MFSFLTTIDPSLVVIIEMLTIMLKRYGSGYTSIVYILKMWQGHSMIMEVGHDSEKVGSLYPTAYAEPKLKS